MFEERDSELFAPYLSEWLRNAIEERSFNCGAVRHLTATVLYADIGGFSDLTAAFAVAPGGAERLHESLSSILTTLISTATAYAGDVVAIAGDALTIWWPDQHDPDRAVRCGEAMIAALATVPPIITPRGPLQAGVRIGVSAGPVTAMLVGLPAYGVHLVLRGPALQAAVTAETRGELGRVRRQAVNEPLVPLPADIVPANELWPAYEHFLHRNFAERLRIGALVTEYRRCVPAFASFKLPESPADLHQLVSRVQIAIDRWGGWLSEVEVGDKGSLFVMLFGAPIASGDEPVRAVGCCLELFENGLIERAGITAGTLFVGSIGSPLRRVYTAQGDEMNLAAHLMYGAESGELRVTSRVRREIDRRFSCQEIGATIFKGHHELVPIARVLPLRSRYGRSGRTAHSISSQPELFGRDDELCQIDEIIDTVSSGTARLLIIEGESGIGKSALLEKLLANWVRMRRPGLWSECRSGQHTPLLPWRPIIADLSGLDEAAPLFVQFEQIEQALQATSNQASDRSMRNALRYLLGLDDSDSGTQTEIVEQAVELAACLVQRRLERGPLLIVLDDVHWADEATLRVAERIAATISDRQAQLPLLLALSLRPMERISPVIRDIQQQSWCRHFMLSPLAAPAAQSYLAHILGIEAAPAALAQIVDRQSQGQPLFIREYVRALRENRIISGSGTQFQLLGNPAAVAIPDTIQGIIQARVDRLDEATRLTLKVAAVIGRTFSIGLLRSIHPAAPDSASLDSQIDTLVQLNIVQPELLQPERLYRFKHHMTHEVAYASLLYEQRRDLHTRVARWYERNNAEDLRLDRSTIALYQLLIGHYSRAGNRSRLARYSRTAAELAAGSYANATALEYLTTALALTITPLERAELLLLRLLIGQRSGAYAAQESDLASLNELAISIGDPLLRVRAAICRIRWLLDANRIVDALTALQRMGELLAATLVQPLEQLPRERVKLLGLYYDLRGEVAALRGDRAAARNWYDQALPALQAGAASPNETSGSTMRFEPGVPHCLNHLAELALLEKTPGEALRYAEAARSEAEQRNDQIEVIRALTRLSNACLCLGDLTTAHDYASQALTIARAIGDRRGQTAALQALARRYRAAREHETAQRMLQQALANASSAGLLRLEQAVQDDIARKSCG
jgi:predicted ATPase